MASSQPSALEARILHAWIHNQLLIYEHEAEVMPRPIYQITPALDAYMVADLAVGACESRLSKKLKAENRRSGGVQSPAGSMTAVLEDELIKHESYRLGTFSPDVWVYDHPVDARELARNGFFYAGPGDRVQCAFCQGLLRNWKPGDRVDEQHAQHFAYCRFVQGHDVDNVPNAFCPLVPTPTADPNATDSPSSTLLSVDRHCVSVGTAQRSATVSFVFAGHLSTNSNEIEDTAQGSSYDDTPISDPLMECFSQFHSYLFGYIEQLHLDECYLFYKRIRQRRATVISDSKTSKQLLGITFASCDEKETPSIAQNVGRSSYQRFWKKQFAAKWLIDHLAGAQNELRKWPGRCGVHLERGTRVIVFLCLVGRSGQVASDLANEPQSRGQLLWLRLLQLLDGSCHVNQPRSADHTSDWHGFAVPFGFWTSDGFSDVPAETSIDRPMSFKLVVPQDSDMPAEAFFDKHTTSELIVPHDSHDVNVPLKHLTASPAISPCDATAEAACKDCEASANIRLHYDIACGLTVATEYDSKRKLEADVKRAKMIRHGESVAVRHTTCVTPRECVTRLVEGYGARPYNRLCNAIVYTGAVLFGASATSVQQLLGGKLQLLAQLAVGRCQNGFSLELLRLASLVDWPHLGKLSALRCSSAGFHRKTAVGTTSSGDNVTCFSCGCVVEKWTADVHPMALHRDKCSQHCRFITEPLNSRNIPLGKDPIMLPVSGRAKEVLLAPSLVASSTASTAEIPSAADCMSSLGVRPSKPLVTPALGAYSEAAMAAIASGSSLVKELIAVSRTTAGTASASRDDVLTKHESYRLDTFSNVWVYDHIVDARELARNGFFYAGPGDRVQCAYCQGLLRNWEPGDRVDEQHSQHFTYCRFVQGHEVGNVPIPFWPLAAKQAADVNAADTIDASRADLGITSTPPKNPEFAIEARRLSTFATWPATHHLQPDLLARAGFFYLGKEDAARCFFCDGTVVDWRTNCDPWMEHAQRFPSCSFVLQVKGHDFVQQHRMQNPPAASNSKPSLAVDPREVRARMDSNKVRVLLHMDYPLDLIREVVQKRLATVGSDHETSEQLLDDVFQTHDEKQKANSAQNPGRRATSDSSGPVVISRRPARGADEPDVQSLPNDVARSPMVAMAASAPAAAKTDDSLTVYNLSAAAEKFPPLISLPATAQPPEEENRQLKTQLTCKVCMDSLVGIVFLPCGHLVCCASCAPAMTTCPICRVSIRGTVRTVL